MSSNGVGVDQLAPENGAWTLVNVQFQWPLGTIRRAWTEARPVRAHWLQLATTHVRNIVSG